MAGKFNPGCNCCDQPTPCQYFDETFDVDLSEWTQVSGTWTVTGGKVETTSTNAILKCNTEHPGGVPTYSIRLKTNATTDTGGQVRLIVDYTDADNYAFMEIEWETPADPADYFDSGGYLRFGTRIAGVETWIGDEVGWGGRQPARSAINVVGANQEHTLTVCLLNNYLRVEGTGGTGFMVPYTPVSGSGFFALGTGGNVPDAIKFGMATATKTGGGCATCRACFNCAGTVPVNAVEVSVSEASGDAAEINGSYTLPFAYERGAVCVWYKRFDSPIGCDFTEVVYYASGGGGGGSGDGRVDFTVGLHHDESSPRETFNRSSDFLPFPCDPSGEEFVWFNNSGYPAACAVEDVEMAVVTVEAVEATGIDFLGCENVPTTLTATVTASTCAGLVAEEIPVEYDAGTDSYHHQGYPAKYTLGCGDKLEMELTNSGFFAIDIFDGVTLALLYSGSDFVGGGDVSCDPFVATASAVSLNQVNGGSTCCEDATETATVVYTE